MDRTKKITIQETDIVDSQSKQLYTDVCELIENTRQRTAVFVNTELCMMHWLVGKRINEDVLFNKRAEYGKQIVKNLAKNLTEKYGKGWSDRKLTHCIRAANTFTEEEIVYALRIQLTWTHLRSIMFIDDELKRAFYIEMCRLERWDTRTLDEKLDAQLYERTILSKKPEIVIKRELEELKATNITENEILPQPVAESENQILPHVVAELPWGHNRLILSKIKDREEALYYAEAASKLGWTRNLLLNIILFFPKKKLKQ